MKKYSVEFIGTFFLVLTVGCTVIEPGAGNLAPLAIGSVLMIMIFAGGHISGGHYNPAVTLAATVLGKCLPADAIAYMISQVIGGILAAFVVVYLKEDSIIIAKTIPVVPSLVAEFLFTFALAYVVFNTATAKGTEGNSFYGLAIGFTVMVGAFSVGGISLAAFNPAVAVGISVMGISAWANIWVYLVATFAGGAVAALVFKAVDSGD